MQPHKTEETAVVIRVIDGDTIDVEADGATIRVRLLCVDTPEFGQTGAAEATAFLEKTIAKQKVRLEADPTHDDKDHYGRSLRYVWLDKQLANAMIVHAGHSTYWTKYGRSSLYEAEFTK